MAQVLADRRDMEFVLYEQMKTEDVIAFEKFAGFNRKMFDMIIAEARTFAVKELLPTYAEGDRIGLKFENGEVKVPECFHRPHELLIEGEWTSLTEDPAWGGQGLPVNIFIGAEQLPLTVRYRVSFPVSLLIKGTSSLILSR